MSEELYKEMAQSIIDGDSDVAVELANKAIAMGMDPLDAHHKGLRERRQLHRDEFSCGNAFLPELVMAGEAMKAAVLTLEPEMVKRGSERQMLGQVVLATVEGDIHEIGKSLVGTMLGASGFQVYALGVDVPTDKFIASVRETGANLLGLSALLTTTMTVQKQVMLRLYPSSYPSSTVGG